jgi:hypothetical protein
VSFAAPANREFAAPPAQQRFAQPQPEARFAQPQQHERFAQPQQRVTSRPAGNASHGGERGGNHQR